MRRKSGNRRWDIGVLPGLEGVVAAKLSVDEGEGGLRSLEEKTIEVAANEAVEGSELRRRQAPNIPRCYIVALATGGFIRTIPSSECREAYYVVRNA